MRLPHNRGGLRTYLIVLGLVAGQATPATILGGTPFLLLGIALHLWAKGCLHQEREVTNGGPYRFVRHPFYVANAFLDFGIALMSGWWVLQIVLPFWWLAIYVPTMRREEAAMIALFGDDYRAYRRRVPLLIPYRRPLPNPTSRFSWANGNLWRTEFPRAFRFLSYPLLFVLSYRLAAQGPALLLRPTLSDVLTVAACVATLGVGLVLRRHFKHRRPVLPPRLVGSLPLLLLLLAILLVGTSVRWFELESGWINWPQGLGLLALSALSLRWRPAEPAIAQGLLAVGLAVLFELQWLALLLVPLCLAIVVDRRLSPPPTEGDGSRSFFAAAASSRAAYGFVLAAGVLLSIMKETWS